MRFETYLNEGYLPVADVLEGVLFRCKPYLTAAHALIKNDRFLWRGMKGVQERAGIKPIRKDRRSRDMLTRTQKIFDDLFEKKFHARLRSECMFCTTNVDVTHEYGAPFIVFPVGKFRAFYNPEIDDLYDYIDSGRGGEIEDEEAFKEMVNGYKEDFYGSMNSHGEIMILCDEYYYVSANGMSDFIKKLKEAL